MIKTPIYICLFFIVSIYSCNNQTDQTQNTQIETKKNKDVDQLVEFETIDTIKDYSVNENKLVQIDSILKNKLSKRLQLDNLINDYKLITLTPKLNLKTILIYSILKHSTKLVTFNDKLDVIDIYEVAYYGGNRIEDGSVEIIEKYSIFKNDSIVTFNYNIEETNGNFDTLSSDKEVYKINNGKIIKK